MATGWYSDDRQINDRVRDLLKAGWRARRGGRHWKITSPCGSVTLTIPGSVSDHRAYLNWYSQARRACKQKNVEFD